jgi:uncharacterized protein involved in type VI secretion and phage assembly
MASGPHYGKYRGVVLDDQDPLGRFRLRVSVPAIGLQDSWAEASLPVSGLWPPFTPPPVDSSVWVEFEEGDADRPIYTGRIVDAAAAQGASPGPVVEPTADGGLSIRAAGGASISLGADGIVLDNGKGAHVALTGPAVSLNHGALEID